MTEVHDRPIVEMRSIDKVYGNGVVANTDVNFSVLKGEIHALVGENGAGKSTLMKILFGIEQPTAGHILIDGKEEKIGSVSEALDLGLGMVQQHFRLVPSMTATENIILGSESVRGPFLDMPAAAEATRALNEQYHFGLDVSRTIEDMSVGERQKVEIMKVLYRKAKVLILDEPTAVLTPQETEELFRQLKALREEGHTIVFISHKLNEVMELCDRISIMRRGRMIGTFDLADMTVDRISAEMTGYELSPTIDKEPGTPGETVLGVKNVNFINDEGKTAIHDLSFNVRAGEIVGLVGVEGNGQHELVNMLCGLDHPRLGTITVAGTDATHLDVNAVRALGVSMIPQERMERGIAADLSVTENIASVICRDPAYRTGPLLNWKKLTELARARVEEFNVKTDSVRESVGSLSGGNIQKVVVAREFIGEPTLIIADQPTRGIDVGAARLIHEKMLEHRDRGAAVLLVSSDLYEILNLSDRILVMFNGGLSAVFPDVRGLTEMDLGFYMLGVKMQSEDELARAVATTASKGGERA